MSFFPADQEAPDILETKDFVLLPLRPGHVHIDYEAVMSSREMLRFWSGSSWPREGFTLEENLADLEWHDQEHKDRIAFTYTVLDPDQDRCLGCVYIRPLTDLQETNPDALNGIGDDEAIIRFWIRASLLDSGLDMQLLEALRSWFNCSWPFSRVYFHTRSANTRQAALFTTAKLVKQFILQYSQRGGAHYFYQAVPAI
jgi:RimJ/RimL family protein N-acetyltransferase